MAFYKHWSNLILGALFAVVAAVIIPYLYTSQGTVDSIPSGIDTDIFNITFASPICSSVAAALPQKVFPPDHPTYKKSLYSYFAHQDYQLKPTCVVKPTDAQEVSSVVKVLKDEFDFQIAKGQPTLRFAVRSGGHSYGTQFSNVDGGLVIDLHHINEINPVGDRQSVVLGTAARWGEVYSKLDAMGLGVAGGRADSVGVGGFLLGGGISFLSPRVGFASGNVLNYEVVLADGTIATASSTKNPDLWRALQGGGNNFGIVTRFTVRSWPLSKLWGGYTFYTAGQGHRLLSEFHEFIKAENFDENAAGPLLSFGYIKILGFGLTAAALDLIYTKPEKWPTCFNGFKAIPKLWRMTKIRTLTDATIEVNSFTKTGLRRYNAVTTFKNDNHTLHRAYDLFKEMTSNVRNVDGIEWAINVQPMPPSVPSKDSTNPFGLAGLDHTLVICLTSARWNDVKDDEVVEQNADSFIAAIEDVARSREVAHPYKYLNYAARGQKDIYDGYGATQKQFLQDTSRKYDPQGFFQRACRGGFKLDIKYS